MPMDDPSAIRAMIAASDEHRRQIRSVIDPLLATGRANHQSAAVALVWELRRMLDLEPAETRAVLRGICQNYLELPVPPGRPS